MINIELATQPDATDLQTISQGIQDYNRGFLTEQVVTEPDTRFAVFARDTQGKVVGGIRANAFWNYCIIELLWLSEATRGSGTGTALMQATEQHAKAQGFEYIRTETVDFQAKGFYQKLGYQVYGEIPDCPKGHTSFCLLKKL